MSKFKTASAMMQEWEEASKRMGDVRTFGNFDEWIAEHDKEVIRQFAEYMRIKCHVDVSEYLEWYEKEQNGL